ncbi:unnamed protein product [Linum tenue]|uniref:Uncharacterized protein n=1 Tax=Linum tenue TaxID=586396 RepID=A0AAV0K3I9_9ROSI|nr:unnamed protein product [Linum tenue]
MVGLKRNELLASSDLYFEGMEEYFLLESEASKLGVDVSKLVGSSMYRFMFRAALEMAAAEVMANNKEPMLREIIYALRVQGEGKSSGSLKLALFTAPAVALVLTLAWLLFASYMNFKHELSDLELSLERDKKKEEEAEPKWNVSFHQFEIQADEILDLDKQFERRKCDWLWRCRESLSLGIELEGNHSCREEAMEGRWVEVFRGRNGDLGDDSGLCSGECSVLCLCRSGTGELYFHREQLGGVGGDGEREFGREIGFEKQIDSNSPRNAVLNLIKRVKPDIFVQTVINGAYNAPFFVTRFRKAMFHFSSLFDIFECTLGREDPKRMMFEREIFGLS